MAVLTFSDKMKLERYLQMGGGYVLDFSNRTFEEFVWESTGRRIYDEAYNRGTGSKANRLREFWIKEPPQIVAKLLGDLLDCFRPPATDLQRTGLWEECRTIATRLSATGPVDTLDAIAPEGTDRTFEALARAARDSIEQNQPETGLDRLHTYVTRLVRMYAESRGVTVEKGKALHSVFGEYVKSLRSAGLIESDMAERILKSSIGTLEAFNHVRNTQSLAHDNHVLGYEESLLIFNHVCSAVRFIRALEEAAKKGPAANPTMISDDDIPF